MHGISESWSPLSLIGTAPTPPSAPPPLTSQRRCWDLKPHFRRISRSSTKSFVEVLLDSPRNNFLCIPVQHTPSPSSKLCALKRKATAKFQSGASDGRQQIGPEAQSGAVANRSPSRELLKRALTPNSLSTLIPLIHEHDQPVSGPLSLRAISYLSRGSIPTPRWRRRPSRCQRTSGSAGSLTS